MGTQRTEVTSPISHTANKRRDQDLRQEVGSCLCSEPAYCPSREGLSERMTFKQVGLVVLRVQKKDLCLHSTSLLLPPITVTVRSVCAQDGAEDQCRLIFKS